MDTSVPVNEANVEKPTKKAEFAIFADLGKDYKKHLQVISNLVGPENFEPEYVRELIRIAVFSQEDFRTLQNYFSTERIEITTLDLANVKPIKILIRGLPSSTPIDEIAEDLKNYNYEVLKVANLKNRTTKNPMPLFMAALKPTPHAATVYALKKINFLTVQISEFNSPDVRQCYNCQGYGHSSLTCKLPAKCLCCGGSHQAKICPKPKDTPAICANCGGPHPANYRGCKNNPKNKKAGNAASVNPPTNKFIPAATPVTSAWKKPLLKPTAVNNNSSNNNNNINNHNSTKQQVTPSTSSQNTPQIPVANKQTTGKTSQPNPPSQHSAKQPQPSPTPQPSSKLTVSSDSPSASTTSEFFEVIKAVREFCRSFNLKEITELFKSICEIFKSGGDPVDKFMKIVEKLATFFSDSPSRHG